MAEPLPLKAMLPSPQPGPGFDSSPYTTPRSGIWYRSLDGVGVQGIRLLLESRAVEMKPL